VIAWMEANGVTEISDASFLLDAVQMTSKDDVGAFLNKLTAMGVKPSLIVLDTFARSFVGGEENSANEVGMWVEASRKVQAATGATVIAVHHSGKPREDGTVTERGSSALKAAVETAILVTKDNKDVVTLQCKKQKDDEEFDDIKLDMKPAFVGNDEDGEPVMSLVLVPSKQETKGAGSGVPEVPKNAIHVFEALKSLPSGEGQSGEWQRAVETAAGKRMPESSFHRKRKQLVKSGLVEEVEGEAGRYRVVPAAMAVPPDSHGTALNQATTTPTPL